ncbi:hypothetical protein BH09PAT3_BH09PAT3_6440 [soil metagenome]
MSLPVTHEAPHEDRLPPAELSLVPTTEEEVNEPTPDLLTSMSPDMLDAIGRGTKQRRSKAIGEQLAQSHTNDPESVNAVYTSVLRGVFRVAGMYRASAENDQRLADAVAVARTQAEDLTTSELNRLYDDHEDSPVLAMIEDARGKVRSEHHKHQVNLLAQTAMLLMDARQSTED